MEKNDDLGIPGDLKTSIYSESVRRGGEKEYEKVLEVYRAPPTPAHELSAIAGLCSPSNEELIDRTLGMMLSGEIKTSVSRSRKKVSHRCRLMFGFIRSPERPELLCSPVREPGRQAQIVVLL